MAHENKKRKEMYCIADFKKKNKEDGRKGTSFYTTGSDSIWGSIASYSPCEGFRDYDNAATLQNQPGP